jgi:competence protein ComGC
MIVATFRAGTPAAGQTVEYDNEAFRVTGGGQLTAQQLWEYDQAGQLEWAQGGLREWAFGLAQPAYAPPPGYGQPPVAAKKSNKPLIIVLAVVGAFVALFIVGIVAAIAIPMFVTQNDRAKESSVKEGVHSIQIGVQSWAVDHDDQWPDPSIVNADGLSAYMDSWPTNPWTDAPMAMGTEPGDFTYSVDMESYGFSLIGYGADGKVVIVVP